MEKRKIGIDIDETLADTMIWINRFYNFYQGTNFVFEDYKTYPLWETWGITKEKHNLIIEDFFKSSFFESIKPIEGSQEAIRILSKDYGLTSITSRHGSIHHKTLGFVRNYFPEIKKIVSNGGRNKKYSKLDVCLENKIGYFIDDSKEIIEECAEGGIFCFLMDKPWNQNCEHENITRVKGWKEILEKLNAN